MCVCVHAEFTKPGLLVLGRCTNVECNSYVFFILWESCNPIKNMLPKLSTVTWTCKLNPVNSSKIDAENHILSRDRMVVNTRVYTCAHLYNTLVGFSPVRMTVTGLYMYLLAAKMDTNSHGHVYQKGKHLDSNMRKTTGYRCILKDCRWVIVSPHPSSDFRFLPY